MMPYLALGASLVVAVQIIYILATGSTLCPNEGCELVEKLTTLPPLFINILGLLYFQTVFWSHRYLKKKSSGRFDFMDLLLLAGLAAEGVLLAYQLFVARTFCGYCLLIFFFVLLLNLLNGRRQSIVGVSTLSAIVFAFSLLSFSSTGVFSQPFVLESGSYGLKSCAQPSKEIFLIFSSDCTHCLKVIEALENCNSCNFYLNPVEKLKSFELEGLELKSSYSPAINRLILKLLGIGEVPVLVVKNANGFSFIKGENSILAYVRRACFDSHPVLYLDQSLQHPDEEMTVLTEDGGECSVELDCEDK